MSKKMTAGVVFALALMAICLVTFFQAGISSAIPLTREQVESLASRGELEQALAARDSALEGFRKSALEKHTERLSVGDRRALLILVDFEDNPAQYGLDHFREKLFSKDEFPTGSFRDFYLDNSYGKLDIEGDVAGWYRMPNDYSYYVNHYYGFGSYPQNAQKLVEDAVSAADEDVDFSDYDNDDDGIVDMLIVAHAGVEGAGDPDGIWSHVSATSGFLPTDGVYVFKFAMCPEISSIGVYCHEFGHVLGLPDLYDTDYSSTGVGSWTLMASGAHNGGGETPAHLDAWCKMRLGWIEPILVEEKLPSAPIPAVENEPVVYQLWTLGNVEDEYFLIENRQRIGFDAELPGDGLLIYHIDNSVRNNRDENHYKVAVEQADGLFELESGGRADSGDPFPGITDNRRFDSYSTPNSRDYGNNKTHVEIVAISDSGLEMTANIAVKETSPDFLLATIDIEDQDDGEFSAGETLSMRFRIENRGFASGLVTGELHTDDEYISIPASTANFPEVEKDEMVWSLNAVEVQINPDCPCPHKAELSLDLVSGDYMTILEFSFYVCSTYTDTFEQKDVFWEHSGLSGSVDEWHQSTQRNATVGGVRSAKCGSESRFEDYRRSLDDVLVSPIIGVREGAIVTFNYYMEAEVDDDGFGVDVGLFEGTEDGETWIVLTPDGGYPLTASTTENTPVEPGSPCFGGTTDGFQQISVTCPRGLRLQQFRFRFLTNVSGGMEGWYIDDFSLSPPSVTFEPPVILAGGFLHTQVVSSGDVLRVVALATAFGEGNSIDSVELLFDGIPLGVALLDEGGDGDDIAGDGIYSALFPVPYGIPSGEYVLQVVATDEQGQESAPWPQLRVGP
ncbi:MAG: M6 family metalloprotease domain-containing protein [Candidatus Coatesbacteria bacterium]|nr:M6 family metalloprotease domain-containing protein [Candidatus Coatesbacteria bacterium]